MLRWCVIPPRLPERSRHELYRRLEEVLGPEAATTLIEHLPPVGWADVATGHDLARLEQRIDQRLTAATSDLRATFEHELRSQSETFVHELRSQTTTMVLALVGVVLTMAALAFALVRFA